MSVFFIAVPRDNPCSSVRDLFFNARADLAATAIGFVGPRRLFPTVFGANAAPLG
jgi:hypothetical protein